MARGSLFFSREREEVSLSSGIDKFLPNLFSSFVLFLIAVPLNLGIALASGGTATQGMLTGLVAALVVSLLAGAPLMVSAPATGLIAVVWQITDLHGMAMLGFVVLMAGLCQILIGLLRLGPWFRAVTPAVIQGMLAGIGLLIFASQFHVMMGSVPARSGLENFAAIPHSLYLAVTSGTSSPAVLSALVGSLTIVAVVAWNRASGRLKLVPPPLVGALVGISVALLGGFEIAYVSVPDDLSSEFNLFHLGMLESLKDGSVWGSILGLTFIATAQTLLTATAVDRLHEYKKTNYNREVIAQGAGNAVAGFLGGLPLCGVIVRSAANLQSGANSRWANFLHGLWLFIFVALLSAYLAFIPIPTLAAVLVYTGLRLVNIEAIRELRKFGRGELAIYLVTVSTIVTFDLLVGIMAGFALSALRLLYSLTHCDVVVEQPDREEGPVVVDLRGSATFFTLPSLARRLEDLPKGAEIEVSVEGLTYIDHACLEQLLAWEEEYVAQGGRTKIAWSRLMGRFNSRYPNGSVASALPLANGGAGATAAATDIGRIIPEGYSVQVRVATGCSTADFLNKAIWELAPLLPPAVAIARVQRREELLVPKGKKVLQEGDVLTLVGDQGDVEQLCDRFQDALFPRRSSASDQQDRPGPLPLAIS